MTVGPIGDNFLGLEESTKEGADIAILSLPYELTVSYGQGTENGPAACIEASAQVELNDSLLSEDLPAGRAIFTAEPWDGEGGSLKAQLKGIEKYLVEWTTGQIFPVVLGGEHGSLPAIMRALSKHPTLAGDLGRLTVVQIDAHADLRDELEGDNYSHACAARRALDEGVGNLLQIGVRAYSQEEEEFIESDDDHYTTAHVVKERTETARTVESRPKAISQYRKFYEHAIGDYYKENVIFRNSIFGNFYGVIWIGAHSNMSNFKSLYEFLNENKTDYPDWTPEAFNNKNYFDV